MSAHCRLVRVRLPRREGEAFDGALGRHVEECLRCQAEQARYRNMHRGLAALADVTYPVPSDLGAFVLVEPDLVSSRSAGEPDAGDARRTAVAAAAGAAVVAAGAVVLYGLRRTRAA